MKTPIPCMYDDIIDSRDVDARIAEVGLLKDARVRPSPHIDWDAAGRALREDYTFVEFDGVTFWVR